MRTLHLSLASALFIASSLPANAGIINGFIGPWAPTIENGFESVTGATTFTTVISPDGSTVTSILNNQGDITHPSFFLQNYTGNLPVGAFSYDYAIALSSPTGFIAEFDDFGHDSLYESGTVLTGHVSGNYPQFAPSPYFGYFGINISDGQGTASATVTLTNFTGPSSVPEPATLTLITLGLAGMVSGKRRKL